MRILEALIVLSNFAAIIFAIERAPGWASRFAIAAFLLLLIHLLVEKGRWQMMAAYTACIGFLAYCLLADNHHSWLIGAIGAILILCSVIAAMVLPVFTLPRPGGPYAIGTVTRHWTAPGSSGQGDVKPRKLTIQFWYPTEARSGMRSPYRTNDARGVKSHLRLIRTHSWMDVPVASSPDSFPVILFSPGWKGHLTQNTVQFEMLASRGFIVLSLEHPPAQGLPADFDPSLEKNLRGYSVEVRLRARDVLSVLDQLEAINQHDPEGLFEGRLDTLRTGMFGYSFGGATTFEACWLDRRLKAGINMDGMLFGESAENGVEQPFLTMSGGGALPTEEDLQCSDPRRRVHMRALDTDMKRIERSLARHGGYYLRGEGMFHSNFSDRPLYSPLRRLTHAGPIRVNRAMHIINEYTLAFFEQHLNHKPEAVLARPSQYSEIQFDRHQAPDFEALERA
jgi:hypothetical protein